MKNLQSYQKNYYYTVEIKLTLQKQDKFENGSWFPFFKLEIVFKLNGLKTYRSYKQIKVLDKNSFYSWKLKHK